MTPYNAYTLAFFDVFICFFVFITEQKVFGNEHCFLLMKNNQESKGCFVLFCDNRIALFWDFIQCKCLNIKS